MTAREIGRRAARAGVVAVAALASIATSQARWHVAAAVPPNATDAHRGTLVHVEASHPVVVQYRAPDGSRVTPPELEAEAPRHVYLLPAGASDFSASIGSVCESAGLCSGCTAPPGAFVRVTRSVRVAVWSLAARSDDATISIDPQHTERELEFDVESSSKDFTLKAVPASPIGDSGPSVNLHRAERDGARWIASWSAWQPAPAPREITFHVEARSFGRCPGDDPCEAPAGTVLRVSALRPTK